MSLLISVIIIVLMCVLGLQIGVCLISGVSVKRDLTAQFNFLYHGYPKPKYTVYYTFSRSQVVSPCPPRTMLPKTMLL